MTGDGRPAFIDPQAEWVECFVCGTTVDPENAGGIDLSSDDEYYPEMAPVCPKHADGEDGDDDAE